MIRDDVIVIFEKPREEAIDIVLELGIKAEKYDKLLSEKNPSQPSGMTPTYEKPPGKKRKRKPGQKEGHVGVTRAKPSVVHNYLEHTLENCPECQSKLGKSVRKCKRYIEDIPPVEPQVTEHTIHGYWCKACKKVVYPKVADALPNSVLGIKMVVFTAWLHYLCGLSVKNIVRMLGVFANFKVSPGGLTQAWKNLAKTLAPLYDEIGTKIRSSAVLHADETGWRINGCTHWLWCFATKKLCYYVIAKCRGSPVVKRTIGKIFKGILICDFFGAYNKISALAKQRCFFHLFTELKKTSVGNRSREWQLFRKKLYRLLQDSVRLSAGKERLSNNVFQRRKQRLYGRLKKMLNATCEDKDVKRLIKRLKRHSCEIFTFLEFDGVSPYNNHAEQQMRKPVNTRKVSYQNRSKQGARTHAILMSLFRSAELQDLNPVEWVHSQTQTIIKSNNKDKIKLDLAA